MDGYRQFWNRLIYFNEGLGPQSLERFWATLGVFAAICLVLGLISNGRLRSLAPAATIIIVGAYVMAIGPFMAWAQSCTDCGATISEDISRSIELVYIQQYWGAVFTMGLAALWLGVLISSGVSAVTARNLAFDDDAFDAEPPAVDEMPATGEPPIAEDAPPTDESLTAEEAPLAEETPVAEEPPTAERADA